MKKADLKIEYIPIKELKRYSRNARKHTLTDVEFIENSIKKFGMCDPIGIWGRNNEIVEGHGRLEALEALGYTKAPVIRLDHLTDAERRAYGIAHNKTAENSEWDDLNLNFEINDLKGVFDFSDFGFNSLNDDEEDFKEIEDISPNERERTFEAYNLQLIDPDRLTEKWQMPIIERTTHIPSELIGFNYAKSSENTAAGIHCFVDDYQFERLWNSPQNYIYDLDRFDCFLTPDFSLYLDMPKAIKVWNIYRSRLIGQFYQSLGIEVIPTVSWAEPATFDFCFDGLPSDSVLAISTIGVKRKSESGKIWTAGVDEMIKRLKPCAILEYGGDIGYDYGDITVKRFKNEVTERMRKD